MEILNKIYKRTKEDQGNAMVVLGIMLIVVVLVVGGMLLDLSKAFQMKSAYNDAAQKASQAGIRYQDSEGYLTSEAVAEALRIYETVSRPATIAPGYMSYCNSAGTGRDVSIKIRLVQSDFIRRPTDFIGEFRSTEVNLTDTLQQVLTKIETGTGYVRSQQINGKKYTGLEMEILEATPNVILPSAAEILPDDPNLAMTPVSLPYKCQSLGIRAGASKYTGESGKYN